MKLFLSKRFIPLNVNWLWFIHYMQHMVVIEDFSSWLCCFVPWWQQIISEAGKIFSTLHPEKFWSTVTWYTPEKRYFCVFYILTALPETLLKAFWWCSSVTNHGVLKYYNCLCSLIPNRHWYSKWEGLGYQLVKWKR